MDYCSVIQADRLVRCVLCMCLSVASTSILSPCSSTVSTTNGCRGKACDDEFGRQAFSVR